MVLMVLQARTVMMYVTCDWFVLFQLTSLACKTLRRRLCFFLFEDNPMLTAIYLKPSAQCGYMYHVDILQNHVTDILIIDN